MMVSIERKENVHFIIPVYRTEGQDFHKDFKYSLTVEKNICTLILVDLLTITII